MLAAAAETTMLMPWKYASAPATCVARKAVSEVVCMLGYASATSDDVSAKSTETKAMPASRMRG